ncbi:DUF5410 family protein [Rickettsia endosymbiont of Halotydeus destructor]|uniref:DUF5410 family protein n=1 Tax=Rickettsia endosymbiont of Halotydeus destructor TaxID=2996754 RepID=UPI003BB1A7D5
MADEDDIIPGFVKPEIVDRIVKGEVTAKDVAVLRDSFATKPKERASFVEALSNNLSDDAIHKLNSMVMREANNLLPPDDPNFQCRTADTKIFQELLQVEAERSGMKGAFNDKGEYVAPKISPAIEDHYATLADKGGFYEKRAALSGDAVEVRTAKSVGFMLDAPLARKTEYYNKLSPDTQYVLEDQIRNKEPLSSKPKHTEIVKSDSLTPAELETKTNDITKVFLQPLANTIIAQSLKNLEGKEFSIDAEHKEKITKILSETLQQMPAEDLAKHKAELIGSISQELEKKQTTLSKVTHAFNKSSSYHISTENVKKLAEKVTTQYKAPEKEQPIKDIITQKPIQIPSPKKENDQSKSKNSIKDRITAKVASMRNTLNNIAPAAKQVNAVRNAALGKTTNRKQGKDEGRGR